MSTYNPFQSIFPNNNNATTTSTNSNGLFGANNNNNNNNKSLFGGNNNTSTSNFTFGVNNANNGNISSLLGANNTSTNNASPLFGTNTNNATNPNNNNQNSLFGNPNQNNLFGTNNNNNNNNNNNTTSNTLFGINNNNNNNNNNNIQSNNLLFGINNQNPNNMNQINQIGNLSGINNNQNNNNNIMGNNNFNNNILGQNQYYLENKRQNDYREYQQVLINIENCCNPSKPENMFKDYLYMPIKKGQQPSEVHVYRPYTTNKYNNEKIINDFNIWEEANKKNKNPNEFFPVQISSVDGLLFRNKQLEHSILTSISETVQNEKSLELLNKKIEDEMNSKLMDIKNCHLKLDELELNLSSKVAQYNYLIGTAKENVSATQEIKDNIKKTNDIIEQNNMIELCEKIKKSSSENFNGENRNYIKDMNKEKINSMLDALVEIQNMMNIICNNNKKNLDVLNGMQREVDRILKKNEI